MSNSANDDPDDDEPSFFAKNRIVIIAVATIAVATVVWFGFFSKSEKPKKRSAPVTMITLPPPTPPPPTPPPTPPPPQPEQPKIEDKREEFVEETKPDAAPEPEQAPEEAAPMGSNIQGEGSDAFGLRGKGGGGMIGGSGLGRSGGGGSKYGFYAGQVQTRVADALRNHRKVRSAALKIQVRVWVDTTGRVTRATLSGSSGNPEVDRAIRDEVLTGLQLQSPPPEGMPMPIVMRISATRPN